MKLFTVKENISYTENKINPTYKRKSAEYIIRTAKKHKDLYLSNYLSILNNSK